MESSSEDFRGVIDDLTVENRRLRQKLQKYEQLHCGNLQNDKLFEIRVHGLPASKKRRLERALQDFTSSLGDTGDEEITSTFAQKLSRVPNRKSGPVPRASSSSTSNSRPVDSAYVSMTTSGGQSDARLQKVNSGNASSQFKSSNDQNVQSYLQTMSRKLLPKHPAVMTEKAKKELVVKRLEQLFTGSSDSSHKHSQSKQQQEVSQSAANADRRESEARGHMVEAEGSREAKISLTESQILDAQGPSVEKTPDDTRSGDANTRSHATPDQRPTRPLDLDPSRAQNPEENIEYIKHLGFDLATVDHDRTFERGEGWVYLNLLISMAQLHTLNVTPDFVRDAVHEISTKFELSTEGSRIRWRGGNDGTKLSIDSSEISEASSEAYPYETGTLRDTGNGKSSKPSTETQSGINGNIQSSHGPSSISYNANLDRQRPLLLGQTYSKDPYQYRPMFYHAPQPAEEEIYSFDGNDSPFSSAPIQSSSALDPDGPRHGHTSRAAAQSRLQRSVDPIIFYNRARFYTDLSKDEESMPYNCPLYDKLLGFVVGCEGYDEPHRLSTEGKGAISKTSGQDLLPSIQRSGSTKSISGLSEDFFGSSRSSASEGIEDKFEASGIGGVIPGDNFTVKVQVEHRQSSDRSTLRRRILSVRQNNLLPSALPPPSYSFLPFSSGSGSDEGSGEGEEDDKDVDPYEEEVIEHFVPPRFLNTLSSSEVWNTSSDDQMSDDSSIDLLAHARQLQPEEVAAREREFEENASSAEDKMEEVEIDHPASSVVATVGEQSTMEDTVDSGKELFLAAAAGHKRVIDNNQGRTRAKRRQIMHMS